MKRLYTLLLTLGLLLTSTVFAYEEMPIEATTEVVENNPVKVIQSTIVKLNQLTTASTYSPRMMSFLVDQEIIPLFDFDYIASEVLSASYVTLSEEETVYFSNILKKKIVNTLLMKLAQGRSSSLNFISARPMRGGKIIVVKLNASGYSRFGFNVDLSFHKGKSGAWQVFDVALGYDNLINFYQRMVRVKVRRYGVYGMLSRI
ncbi:hypothetical protein THERMOT_798 [Bathymodiolus thermophilus thioautotrophic gill symbiont]|uniref:Toluene tolerance protein n=1 Tax=Bathymodiolus thermophilus thioautotrophic gill symbiont TaxID=2360 RepID=A0A1J5TUC3_9GAMM|nr:ABC transporter substrate-binding protein [Bathymodiolus thermophilus thioautotrophic gill symbiont]AYQ56649.1 hypothetical protein MS2017_0930 [Bathymodiolus thermophilus thioautotrophic gill symbiont]OIR23756.1 hypothetical protein BGC33_13980 [Bathymodiolus thermophilus thioautotrophic gill symbiont]CAB5498030.1 hypothetical protein THERMOT_798 [Bathymodiolus thermophilus thioautotrophic gill symbiont]CAB5503235.1 hypothetical protein THERMOS_1752 [Bathymodiolus thermophilus thioautotroph